MILKILVLIGFPPKELIFSPDDIVGNLLSSGEVLTLSQLEIPKTNILKSIPKIDVSKSIPKTNVSNVIPSSDYLEIDTSPIEIANNQSLSDYGIVVRRNMPDDNSCLFHSIAYVLEDKKTNSMEIVEKMRHFVSKFILENPSLFNEAILDKTPTDYANWILNNNSWGGSIELAILSDYYKTEIFALDTINVLKNVFGEEKPYSNRVYLIYDGIHYDALVLNPIVDDESLDLVLFSKYDKAVEKMFMDYLTEQNKIGKFTDVNNFQLLCTQCNTGMKYCFI